MRRITRIVVLAIVGAALRASAADVATAPGATVTYTGITAPQATAIANTLSAARKVYVDAFGFDMPATVTATVDCGPGKPTRLYTDGNDRVFLSLPSADKLAKPAVSGTFNLYGLCHELGHVAMYRTLKDRAWLSTAGAEGWAHYAGSVVVDAVYEVEGEKLWADPYDYRADGTARLEKQLAGNAPDATTHAAGKWRELEAIVGRTGFVPLFAALQRAKADPADPKPGLLASLAGAAPADQREAVKAWWKEAAPLLVERTDASPFARQTTDRAKLSGKPAKLAADDDAPDGKRSIAGGAHARQFTSPDGRDDRYLVAVWLHASRYGTPPGAGATFDLSLCDDQNRVIARFRPAYGAIPARGPTWVRLETTPPTRVPPTFRVVAEFNPTATSGVFVSYDASTSGNSFTSPAGKPDAPFKQGDWMIRAELDRPAGK